MDYYLRPVKEHDCGFDTEVGYSENYCKVCLAHALDPSNQVKRTPSPLFRGFLVLLMTLITVWAFSVTQGCATVGPQEDTTVREIHHESCVLGQLLSHNYYKSGTNKALIEKDAYASCPGESIETPDPRR